MSTPIGFDPATWNSAVATPFTLGAVYSYQGGLYRYFRLIDAVAGANGMVVEWASTTSHLVTVDRAGGSSLGRNPCGVIVAAAVTAGGGVGQMGNFFFGLVYGLHPAIKDAANAALVGVKQTTHATADGDSAPATLYTDRIIVVPRANAALGVYPGDVSVRA